MPEQVGDSTLPSESFGSSPHAGLRRIVGLLVKIVLPVLSFLLLVLVWAAAISIFEIPKYLLPTPTSVLAEMVTSRASLFRHGLITVQEIFLGFAFTVAGALPLGLMIALSPIVRRLIYPMLVFVQLIPKIAIAPLFVVWVGFGMESKILLTVMMTFFPLLIASITGFQILDPRYLYLTRSMGATAWQTFRYLRLPSALPMIFAGLKTSATIAATAAIVAEFVGSNRGLGYLLLQATGNLDTPLVFAILGILTIIGLALNYIVEFAEMLMTPWRRAR